MADQARNVERSTTHPCRTGRIGRVQRSGVGDRADRDREAAELPRGQRLAEDDPTEDAPVTGAADPEQRRCGTG